MDHPNRLVAVLIYDGLSHFEFSCAAEIFGMTRPEFVSDWYRFETVAVAQGAIQGRFGLQLEASAGLSRLSEADTVILPGWKESMEEPIDPEIVSALRAAHSRGARLMSMCRGAHLLAASGLLNGKRAATHWRHVETFRRRFPRVEWDPGVIYIDEGQIITSAGSAAVLDACLHLVRRDFGTSIANEVAQRLVIQPHRDGEQSQRIERSVQPINRDRISIALETVARNLKTELQVSDWAQMCAMSERTFVRRFKQKTGTTLVDWLSAARIDRARELLEATDLSVELIASECGLGTATNLRHHFRRKLSVSPTEYRRRFGGRRLRTAR